MKKFTQVIMLVASILFIVPAHASLMTYSDRASFESTLGTSITDDYSNPQYRHGDIIDASNFDMHSNAHMSGIIGETDYVSTGGFGNIFPSSNRPDIQYCAGCNGSFELGFTTTSVGTSDGVFGVGFDFWNAGGFRPTPYHAFVTFGDDSTQDYLLPTVGSSLNPDGFWGITSNSLVKTIHLGLANGEPARGDGHFGIDNLTIGAAAVPEPTTLALFGIGLAGLGFARRRKST